MSTEGDLSEGQPAGCERARGPRTGHPDFHTPGGQSWSVTSLGDHLPCTRDVFGPEIQSPDLWGGSARAQIRFRKGWSLFRKKVPERCLPGVVCQTPERAADRNSWGHFGDRINDSSSLGFVQPCPEVL